MCELRLVSIFYLHLLL